MAYAVVSGEPWLSANFVPDELFDADSHSECKTNPLRFLCTRRIFVIEFTPDEGGNPE